MGKNRYVKKRRLSSKRSRFISGVLSFVLCFSMVPLAYAEDEADVRDCLYDIHDKGDYEVASWVSAATIPPSVSEIDWQHLQPGVDYKDKSMILTFAPNLSLSLARYYIGRQGWTEDKLIVWNEDAGWKCMSVTIADSQSLQEEMTSACALWWVWYSELNRISACPIDGEVSDLPDESIEAPSRQWPFDNQDTNLINPFEDYSEKELYLVFDSDVSLEEALDTVFSMEGWSVGSYLGVSIDDTCWYDSHELLVSIPVNMTVIEAMKIAKQQEGIADTRLVYFASSGPVYQVKPNIAVTFDGKAASGQAEYRVYSLGWQLSGAEESIGGGLG